MATLDQLLNQYGVAYFTFDEETGNVYDKIGLNNYIGTVTGASRIGGWNGIGKAMQFTSGGVSFTDKITPIGEKTYRFKIKVPTATTSVQAVIGNSYATATSHGDFVSIRANTGFLGWHSLKATTDSPRFYLESTINICDNKWHDILLTWDGTTNPNGVKMFIDDMNTPHTTGTANALETATPTYNLAIGKNPSASSIYLNGQLDEIQIYNKALSVSNFPKERVAIKSSTKNYTPSLSEMSTRIKEIPNVSSITLISQGETIQEINYATDNSTSFNLEKTIDEYEVASDINVPLGSGKVFTISTTQEFKTISIEDNY